MPAAGATRSAVPTGIADCAPFPRYQTGLGGVAQSPPPQKVPLACTAQPPPTRVNWYPASSAGRPPIVSARPVAGQNQAGCVPETGSRRLSSHGVVFPVIPVGPTGRRTNSGDATGTGLGVMAGVGWAAEAAGRPCG